eukprot:2531315-Pyramimonas_sp.AAC.1
MAPGRISAMTMRWSQPVAAARSPRAASASRIHRKASLFGVSLAESMPASHLATSGGLDTR